MLTSNARLIFRSITDYGQLVIGALTTGGELVLRDAVFPISVKTWTPVVDDIDTVYALHINELYDEIIAIESYLKST